MARRETLLFVLLISTMLLGINPTEQESLAAIVPVLETANCINTTVAATTSTVATNTLVHIKTYDLASDASDCWFEFKASGNAADNTGRFLPQGVVLGPFHPANARAVFYCALTTTVSFCPNVTDVTLP